MPSSLRLSAELAQASLRRDERRTFERWLSFVTPTFEWHWRHLERIRLYLDKVTAGEIDRLMLFVPPRHGKSEMVTIRYPVWRIERDPGLRVIVGAYNQLLANKFSRKAQRIAAERLELARDHAPVEDWETAQGGGMRAVGVGAGITGQGGNLIVIDDPVKNREEANSAAYRERVWDWYSDDLYTRLEPGGQIILIMTRWHEDDLAGRILASDDGPNWTVVSLPAEAEANDPLGRAVGEALCPERYPADVLARIRGVLRSSYYALYQQQPQPARGTLFQREWFDRGQAAPERGVFTNVVQAWDTAFSEGKEADYSACVTIGALRNRYYVLDAWRRQIAFPDLLRWVKAKGQEWRPGAIYIEDKGSGTSAAQTLARETGMPVVGIAAKGSKVDRANLVTAYCESGRVSIPHGDWGEALVDELVRFPSGQHDDQVDAFVYALSRAASSAGGWSVQEY
jgi:predicted phage terminase large subunit-like protein